VHAPKSDFYLVLELKNHAPWWNVLIDTDDKVEEAVLHFLRGLAGDVYNSKIKKWMLRMQECID